MTRPGYAGLVCALAFVSGLVLPLPAFSQSGLSQNSGINASDTWAAFDLSVQSQSTINNTIQFFNPLTQSNATTYTLSGVPRTYHIELGFDSNGGAVMNLWPTGAPPDPTASDTSLVSMIRFAKGTFTIFDQNGAAIPSLPVASSVVDQNGVATITGTVPALNPLDWLGCNPLCSIFGSLVVPNIQTAAQATNSQLSYSGADAVLAGPTHTMSNVTSNATWTYASSGSVWLAQQATFYTNTPKNSSTRTLSFSNMSWNDNATNDATRIATGYKGTAPPAPTTATPPTITPATDPRCVPFLTNLGGPQNIAFSHGFLSNACVWERMVPWLNQDFRFGLELIPTYASRGLVGIASQGSQLVSDITTATGSNYILLGHSAGGLVSRVAAQHFQNLNPPINPAPVSGVITLDTPHQGAPIAGLPVGFVNNLVTGDATLLYDAFGCTSPSNFICLVASLYFSAATDLVEIGSLPDLVPGSPFLTNLNSQTENFLRAAVVGNTPRRFISTRVVNTFIFGNVCNPEDTCGERNWALFTEVLYDVIFSAWLFAEFDCILCDDPTFCSVADNLLNAWVTMDIVDFDYNFMTAPDFTHGQDGIVPSPSQNYPSTTAIQYPVSDADSHSAATHSDKSRHALDQALSLPPFLVPTQASCSFSVSPSSFATPSAATTSTFSVIAGGGCQWSAVSQNPWISITSGSGTSNGTVSFSVLANSDPFPRSGTITVGNGNASTTFTVQQSALCTYALSPETIAIPPGGGSATVNVSTPAGCPWLAIPNPTATWLSITAGGSGTGSGSFTVTAAANPGDGPNRHSLGHGSDRNGHLGQPNWHTRNGNGHG